MNPELLFTELLEALCAARAWISNEPHWLASHFARPYRRGHGPGSPALVPAGGASASAAGPTPTGFPEPGAAVSAYERRSCARPSSVMVTIVMVTVVMVAAVAPDFRLGCIANVRGGVGRKDPSMLESVRCPSGY